jgi:hypothetical protein
MNILWRFGAFHARRRTVWSSITTDKPQHIRHNNNNHPKRYQSLRPGQADLSTWASSIRAAAAWWAMLWVQSRDQVEWIRPVFGACVRLISENLWSDPGPTSQSANGCNIWLPDWQDFCEQHVVTTLKGILSFRLVNHRNQRLFDFNWTSVITGRIYVQHKYVGHPSEYEQFTMCTLRPAQNISKPRPFP